MKNAQLSPSPFVLIGVRPSVLSATQQSTIFAAATRFSAVVSLRMMRAGRTSTAAFSAAHRFGTVRWQFTAWALSPYCLSLCQEVSDGSTAVYVLQLRWQIEWSRTP
jgi:hypothetical protein